MTAIRWSDNDRYFGPFTYSRGGWCPFALVLGSGDDEDYPGCSLRMSGLGHTVIVALPRIIRPWKENFAKVEPERSELRARIGDYYYHTHERQYGFCLSDGHLIVHLGAQTGDSSTDQSWGCFLPWTQWRHVRHSLYDLDGNHFADMPERFRWDLGDERKAIEEACPTQTFSFADYDGEELTATTKIEEREWRRGEGWFKWLSWFYRPRISRCLDIRFSGETGKRKGSWKGGTIGHAIEMLPDELHEAAFRRYCEEREMTFQKDEG